MLNFPTLRLRLVVLTGAAVASLAAMPASADVGNANLGVSATVSGMCNVTTSPVAFGEVDVTSGSNDDASGGISVVCTNGTAWAAAADEGAGASATIASRKMTSGSDSLNYSLYINDLRTSVWGDGTTGATIDDIGSGSAQAHTVYGRVPSGQTSVPEGVYADTVAVTLTY